MVEYIKNKIKINKRDIRFCQQRVDTSETMS